MIDPISITLAMLLSTTKEALTAPTAIEIYKGILGNKATDFLNYGFKKGWHGIKEIINLRSNEYPQNHDLLRTLRMSMLKATEMIHRSMVKSGEEKQFREDLKKWIDKQFKILPTLSKWSGWENPASNELELFFTGSDAYEEKKALLIDKMTSSWQIYLQSQLAVELPVSFTSKLKKGWLEDDIRIYWHEATMVLMIEALRNPKDEQSIKAGKAFEHNFLSDIKLQVSDIQQFLLDQFANHETITKLADTIASQQRTIETQAEENKFNAETINLITKKQFELEEKLNKTEIEKAQLYLENQSNKTLIEKAEIDKKELIDFYKLYPTFYKSKLDAIESTKNLKQLVKEDDEKRELRKNLEDVENKGSANRLMQLAYQLQKLYDFKGALENYDKAMLLCPELIQAKIAKGYLLHQIGEYHKARNIFVELREENQFESLDTLTKVDIFDAIGSTCLALSRFEEALHSFKNGMYHIKKSHAEILYAKSEHSKEFTFDLTARFNETYAREQSNIGIAYLKVGDIENAYNFLNSSLEFTRNLYGEDNYLIATIYNNLGDTYKKDNKLEKANEYFKKSLNWFNANATQMHYQLLMLFANLSRVNLQLGNKDDALQFATNELTVAESIYGSNSLHTANAYMELGRVNEVNGNWNTALLNFMDAEAIFRNLENENGGIQLTHEKINGIIESHLSIASILMEQEAWSLAIEWFSYPLQIISDLEGEDSIHVGNILADKGLCVFNSRENDNEKKFVYEAIELWRKALHIFKKDQQLKNEITKLEDNILNAENILGS